MSVTPSTDLKPNPKRPISEVPRLGDMGEHESSYAIPVDRLSLVGAVQMGRCQPDVDAAGIRSRQSVGSVLNQLEKLASCVSATRRILLVVSVFYDEVRLAAVGSQSFFDSSLI